MVVLIKNDTLDVSHQFVQHVLSHRERGGWLRDEASREAAALSRWFLGSQATAGVKDLVGLRVLRENLLLACMAGLYWQPVDSGLVPAINLAQMVASASEVSRFGSNVGQAVLFMSGIGASLLTEPEDMNSMVLKRFAYMAVERIAACMSGDETKREDVESDLILFTNTVLQDLNDSNYLRVRCYHWSA